MLNNRPAVGVVAAEEIRKAINNTWSRTALTLVLAYTIVYLGSMYTLSRGRGDGVHTMENFLFFLNNLRWGVLAVGAAMAGPALLEDSRRGALELYLSRAVTRLDYLAGKVLAIVGVTTLAVFIPALLYFAMSFVFFTVQPQDWNLMPLRALVYGLMWGLVVSGLGLGLSCVAKSSRAATLILFGGFAVADVIVANLLQGITRDPNMQLLSPFSAAAAQVEWIFALPPTGAFPAWWGLIELSVLVLIGWGFVAWKHPRLAGET